MVKRGYATHKKNGKDTNPLSFALRCFLPQSLLWIVPFCVLILTGCMPGLTDSPMQLPPTFATSGASSTSTFSPPPTVQASLTPSPTIKATSTAIPFLSQSQSQDFGDLTLIEYPLISEEADLSGDCDVKEEILSPVYEKIFNEHPGPIESYPTIPEVNAIIQPFGYRIEDEAPYGAYRAEELLLELPWGSPGRISVNQSGTDFIWAIFTDVTGGWLIHGETIQDGWAFGQYFFVMPQYMGDDLIRLENRGMEEPGSLEVLINEEVVYSQPFVGSMTADCPVDDLKIWNDHWILDMEDQVVMDGRLLSETTGYAEVFEWLLFYDKPLYFFNEDGRYGMVYDGQEWSISYEEIAHTCRSVMDGRGCSLGIEDYGDTIDFFARRDGMWYFVELLKQE